MSSTSQHCAVVVYESMYGNTHVIAEHIADGLRAGYEVTVVPVDACTETCSPAPTCSCAEDRRTSTACRVRPPQSRRSRARKAPGARARRRRPAGQGYVTLRDDGSTPRRDAAAFDTRIDGPAILTGRASKGVGATAAPSRRHVGAEPESFLVDKQNHLLEGEAERAVAWGATLTAAAMRIPS